VLAWAVSGDSELAALDTALLLPAGSEPERIAWDLVLRASWTEGQLEVSAQDRPGGQARTHRIAFTGSPGALPDVVRDRVNASIVIQHHAPLEGERGARIVARRTPGSTELRWSVVFDPGLDPADPGLRAAADAALAVLRGSLGV
jgi:hypothetical protein